MTERYQITRERLEQELLKLKASVPPDYRGDSGRLTHVDGSPACIMGHVLASVYGSVAASGTASIWGADCIDPMCLSFLDSVVRANDMGEPWHSIVDRFVACSAANAEVVPEIAVAVCAPEEVDRAIAVAVAAPEIEVGELIEV